MTTQLYNQQLKAAMNWISSQDRVMILGQAVCYEEPFHFCRDFVNAKAYAFFRSRLKRSICS